MTISKELLQSYGEEYGLSLTAPMLEQFDQYASTLVEWNEKINLTAITEPKDMVIKHFLDSLLFLKSYLPKEKASMIDVGTGAGFPSVPVKIARPDLQLTLLDSLNKRIKFLEALSQQLGQDNKAVHFRAEEAGRKGEFREQYDIATARAVADLAVLAEYCLPFVKVGGVFVALKGYDCQQEVERAEKAISLLGGKIQKVDRYILPEDNKRSVIVIEKISHTPAKYPRPSAKIAKSSL